ncbi:MAG: YciI family protein [Gemmatimonadaceae bacterium]
MLRRRVVGITASALLVLLAIVFAPYARQVAAQGPQARPPVFAVLYERGPAWDVAKGALEQVGIQQHLTYLRANMDKQLAAAPFQPGLAPRSPDAAVGMVLLSVASEDDAQRFVAGDPAVAAGLMNATVRRWLVDRVKSY